MDVERHQWARLAAVGFAFGVFYVAIEDLAVPAPFEWAVMIAATLGTALAFGHAQYVRGSGSETDTHRFFESRIVCTAFYGLFWALTVHTMALVGSGPESGHGVITTIFPAWIVGGSWATVALVAVFLGGANRNVSPGHWGQEFRRGQTEARRDE